MYKDPHTSYEKFVNRLAEKDGRKRDDTVKAAYEEWRAEKLEEYLKQSDPTAAVHRDVDYGFSRLEKHQLLQGPAIIIIAVHNSTHTYMPDVEEYNTMSYVSHNN